MNFFEMTDIIELPGVEYYPFASGHTVENAEVFFQPQGIYHNSFLNSTLSLSSDEAAARFNISGVIWSESRLL